MSKMGVSKGGSIPSGVPGYDYSDQTKLQLEKDPCAVERQLSVDCLKENNYQKEKCGRFFENYKTCKTFWMKVRMRRMMGGVSPTLPPLEERAAMKKIYMETGKVPMTPKGD